MSLGPSRAPTLFAAGGVVLLAVLVWVLAENDRDPALEGELHLHCAAGIRPPVQELAREYEERYGVRIALHYGGSGTLLGGLRIVPNGDLYLAGDDSFIDLARDAGLVREAVPLARMRAVIAVAAGNPLGIETAADLQRDDVRLALADPDAAAVGGIARAKLTEAGLWEPLAARARVFKPTVTDLANDLRLGAVDAAILWDATVAQFPELDAVRVPAFEADPREITIGVLAASARPREALRFARFLGARDAGLLAFARHGYEPVRGDAWEVTPRISILSGAMLSPAVRETIAAFEEREGARVDTTYNGCGILVAQMRAGLVPDAYFACDSTFLDQVTEIFEEGVTLTDNDMVVLVQPGNPLAITGLEHLVSPGLRVGLAHPEKSALGALTVRLLEREGLAERLAESGNVVVDSPTGDLLVNQLRTGSLDAVVVYRSNAAHARDAVKVVSIAGTGARATQPVAVARDSDHKHLLGRLFDALTSDASQARFEALGFRWVHEGER